MASWAEGLLALLLLSLLAKAVMSGQRPFWKRQDPWPWHQHTHSKTASRQLSGRGHMVSECCHHLGTDKDCSKRPNHRWIP